MTPKNHCTHLDLECAMLKNSKGNSWVTQKNTSRSKDREVFFCVILGGLGNKKAREHQARFVPGK